MSGRKWVNTPERQTQFAVDGAARRGIVEIMSARYVVIMAGGRGERFWPASRQTTPKHLLPIVGETPMLTQTVDRVLGVAPKENIFVITTQAQLAGVRAACPQLPVDNIVAEPMGRDTAAATGLAMLLVKQRDPQAAFAMLPADHVIHDVREYQSLLGVAFAAAESADVLVTLGIKPTEPATGFGYIEQAGPWKNIAGRDVIAVRRFVEKPDVATAESYVASGKYFWNAGMFVWRVPVVEAGFRAHASDLHAGLAKLEAMATKDGWAAALAAVYPTLKKIQVDYALMEKSTNVVVVPATFDWDDVGAWPAVAKHFPRDAAGNVLRGLAMVEGGANNIVFARDDHLTAVVGASDLVVVTTADATLVCPRSKAQEIKSLLKRLEGDAEKKKFL
jgi:mannose-1-phosphate guanylyltransferase